MTHHPYELTGDVRHLRSSLWNHRRDCKLRVATDCAIPIECEHGRDVCPICDPCTCKGFKGEILETVRSGAE